METKICGKCHIKKSIDEFSKGNDKDGLDYWCKKCVSKYHKKWYQDNSDKIKTQSKKYYQNNSEGIKRKIRKYKRNNPEKINKYQRKYDENNSLKISNRRKVYYKKLKKNPIYKLNINMSSGIRQSLKNNKNGHHWEGLIGYTLNDLKNHLEKQFKEGMTWENYGKWHIDHKIPKSLFNINSIRSKGFRKCWALENLQPLWGKDNISKYNKLFS